MASQRNLQEIFAVVAMIQRFMNDMVKSCFKWVILIEAGRFLFLSGKRTPEYENAIKLYLGRYTRKDFKQVYRNFPRAAKLEVIDNYPMPLNMICMQ